jgi:hypothetical protein
VIGSRPLFSRKQAGPHPFIGDSPPDHVDVRLDCAYELKIHGPGVTADAQPWVSYFRELLLGG